RGDGVRPSRERDGDADGGQEGLRWDGSCGRDRRVIAAGSPVVNIRPESGGNMTGDHIGGGEYVLGPLNAEGQRLVAQRRVFEPLTGRFLLEAGREAGLGARDGGWGVGDVSFLAARLVGPGGQVGGLDRSSTAIETARGRAQEMAASNVRFLVGDAGAM